MNSFTYEKTFNYIYSKNRYVAIRKYMIVKDEEGQRYAIFQLVNNYRDLLQQVRLKVEQYDHNNNLVYTNDIPYEGLSIKHNGKFVPFFKLALDPKTTRISTSMVAAKFENHIYVDEKMIRVKNKKEKVEEEKELKDKIVKRYNALSSKSPFKSFMIMSLISTILIALIIGAFSITNKESVYNNYQYNRNTGEIVAYYGADANVTVPSTIKNIPVTKIGKNAFKNSNLVSVTFESQTIEIGDSAFINCRYLRSVAGGTITNIGESAFENCYSLTTLNVDDIYNVGKSAFKSCTALTSFDFQTCKSVGQFAFNRCTALNLVNVPNAIVTTNVFYDNPQLRTFTFGNVDAYYTRLFTIFSNESDFPSLEVNNYIKAVDFNFLTDFNCGRLNFLNPKVSLPSSVKTQWQDLATRKGAIVNTGQYSKIFDVITSFTNPGTTLKITDHSIKGISSEAWSSIASNLREIEFNNYIKLSADMLNSCRYLTSLKLGVDNYIEDNAISSAYLESITLPVCGTSFSSLFASNPMGQVEVKLVGSRSVKSFYFASCRFVSTIIAVDTIDTFEESCITNCASLNKLVVNCLTPTFAKGFIGTACNNLTELEIPFIGVTKTEPAKYREMNLSYDKTRKITFNGGSSVTLVEGCFEQCSALDAIYAPLGYSSSTKNILNGKGTIYKMSIGVNLGSSLQDVIGASNKVTNVLFVNATTFPDGYFNGTTDTRVFLGRGTAITQNMISEGTKLNSLYISSSTYLPVNGLSWLDKENGVSKVYINNSYEYVPTNYQIMTYNTDGSIEELFN